MYNIEEYLSSPNNVEALRKAISSPGEQGFLLSAKIKLTYRCNLRCTMCGFWRYRYQAEIDTETVKRLISDLAQVGAKKVHFSGGEPFTRKDIFEIIGWCKRLEVRANLTSNGTLINKEVAKGLIKAGARSISISLDAPDASTHDGIRGVKGAFKSAVNAIELLTKERENLGNSKRPRIRINTVLQRRNWRKLPQLVELAGNLGVDEIQPMPVDSKDPTVRLKKSEIKDYNILFVPEIKEIRLKYGFSTDDLYVYPFGKTKDDLQYAKEGDYALGYYKENLCYAPWLHTFVMWDGRVFPCCMTRSRISSLGNITRRSIVEIFRGEKYSLLRKSFTEKRLPFCNKCDNFLHENRLISFATS